MTLSGKTLFITGASRGIGLAIALRAARARHHGLGTHVRRAPDNSVVASASLTFQSAHRVRMAKRPTAALC